MTNQNLVRPDRPSENQISSLIAIESHLFADSIKSDLPNLKSCAIYSPFNNIKAYHAALLATNLTRYQPKDDKLD